MTQVHSLRTRILVIAFAFILVIGSAFFAYTIVASANYKTLRLESIQKTVELEAEKINKIVSEIEKGAVFFAIGAMICYEQSQESELSIVCEKFALDFLSCFPAASGCGFWFEPYSFKNDQLRAGFYAFYDKKQGDYWIDDSFLINEYNYHSRNWYRELTQEAFQPGIVKWTKPYVDDSGTLSLMTTSGAGVFDENGKLKAISTIDWEIEKIIDELAAIKPTKNSFILLCVPEKDYVISSTRTRNVTGASIKSIPWDITADVFNFEGTSYMRFGRYIDNGWLLSIQIPANEIFAEIERDNRNFSVFIAAASIFLLLLAFFLISKYINNPLKRLTTEVSQLVFGNLDKQLQFTSKDELGVLAGAFNKVTGELKKFVEENMREHAENERINTELNIANEIQESMLPGVFPPFPGRNEFDLYASMFPAKHVGGDFYDFYFIDGDNLAIIIADVLGKSIPAALFMVVTKTLIETCSNSKSPKEVFEIVNDKLMKNNKAEMFVTAFMGIYNIQTGRFVYASAGHNPPLLKKKDGQFKFLNTQQCIVLAWMENAKFAENEIFLENGDTLFLYTDGVTEAMNMQLELFSEERLVDVLNKNKNTAVKGLLDIVKRELDAFREDAEQADDITMLALNITDKKEIKQMELEAKPENLNEALNFINNELRLAGFKPDNTNEIDIAVEEIFMNIANYAYKPESGSACIYIDTFEKISIIFEDSGRPYNPLEQAPPDLEIPPAKRDIGGLGVFLVKKIMDNVEYERRDGKNILKITKNCL